MGSCHSVILGSQKREDMPCCDIEHKHGKTWNILVSRGDHLSLTSVFRFCLFMGVSFTNMQNDEEQNAVAVKLPKNCSFLLKQLKNWITNKFPGFNAATINSPIYQEPIYRSPGAGQQMGNVRYSVDLQIENHNAFYEGANRFQMLPWDAHEPPPKRVTRDGSWYIVSMEVFKNEIDLGGRCPDSPEVHLKVILHIVNRRMTWTPPDFGPFDIHCQTEKYRYNDVLSPCVLNYHVDYTLSPEELSQLARIQKYLLLNEQPKDPIPKDTRTLIPGFVAFNHGSIHLDCRKLSISSILHTVPRSSHYKSEYTRALVPGLPGFNHGAIHVDRQNLNVCRNPTTVLHSPYYKPDFNLNFLNPVSTIIPNPHWFNNEAILEDHEDLNTNRNSKKCPLSTNIKAGNSAAPGLSAIFILLLLAPPVTANPDPQGRQVGIEILRDSNNLNCTLKIDNKYSLCYGHCDQNQKLHQNIFSDTVENMLGNVCEQQKKAMEVNQISLMKKHSLSSGTLRLILIWELCKDLNLCDVIIQYKFDDKNLPEEEITNLPMPIIDFPNADPNSPVYKEKRKDYVKEIWKSISEKLLPFLKIDDQPDTSNLWIIAIAITIFVIGCISLVVGVTCRRAGQNEGGADVDPSVMEALKKEDHVTVPV